MSLCFSWPFRRRNHRFALDRLPADVLKEILQYLPFDQRVRIARVNRRLQVISEITISQMQTLQLNAPICRRIPMESMAKMIELGAANTQYLVLHVDKIEELAALRERLQLLWGLPRLSTFVLKAGYGTSSLFGVIQEILVKIPSLRSLEWEDHPCGIDDNQQIVACDSLERVDLKLDLFPSITVSFTRVLRFTSFLNNCSNLKYLALRQRAVECITTMNRMDSLQSLILDNIYYSHSKQLLEKIPVSFPQLVDLEMHLTHRNRVENEEMGWLATLKNLRNIKIEYLNDPDDHFSNTDALQLIRCECLQIADFPRHRLNPTTVYGFTRHCPQLRKLTVRNIRGINSESAASDFILSLAGFVQHNLTIVLQQGYSYPWECPEVKSALTEINQRLWRRLSIEVGSKRVGKVVDLRVQPKKRKSRCQKMIGRILGAFRRR